MGEPSSPSSSPRVALCLPGGGLSGALYQIGALADGVLGLDGQSFSLYLGHSSGATVAAAIAGGVPVDRIYRALLDPTDNFFPLERGHLLRLDMDEWGRTLQTGWAALRQGIVRLGVRKESAAPAHHAWLAWLEQLDRLYDSLPAGVFTLDRYERFVAEFLLRRAIPNTFRSLPRTLRITAHDLDSGERVVFGGSGFEDVPVSLACAASLALPVFFSPVRIGSAHYIDGGLGQLVPLDIAEAAGVDLLILVNPLVPVRTAHRAVPTGHGARASVRDKGMLWVYNQALRIGAHARLPGELQRAERDCRLQVLVLEPEPTDAVLFLHNPANHGARRAILEYAYRTTRERMARWIQRHAAIAERVGWHAA